MIYVRCINCSYNNVAKGICLLDKNIFCLYRKTFMQVRAFERYIPLMRYFIKILKLDTGNWKRNSQRKKLLHSLASIYNNSCHTGPGKCWNALIIKHCI